MGNFGAGFMQGFNVDAVASRLHNAGIKKQEDDRQKKIALEKLQEKQDLLKVKEFQMDQKNKTVINSTMKELTTQLSKVPEENFADAANDMWESFPTDTGNEYTDAFNKKMQDNLAGLVSADLNSRDNANKSTDVFDEVDKGKKDITKGINELIALKHSTINEGVKNAIGTQIETLKERQAGEKKVTKELSEFKSKDATELRQLKDSESQAKFEKKERFKASLKADDVKSVTIDPETGKVEIFEGSQGAMTKAQIGKRQTAIFDKEDQVRKLDRLASLIKPGTGGGISEFVQKSMNIVSGNISDAKAFLSAKSKAKHNPKFFKKIEEATGIDLFDENLPKKDVAALDLAFKIAKSTGGVITKADWQFAKALISDPSGSRGTLLKIQERRDQMKADLKVDRERIKVLRGGKATQPSLSEIQQGLAQAKKSGDRESFDKLKALLETMQENQGAK